MELGELKAKTLHGPEARHLYLLVAGIIAGVLLGPGVLGRVLPEVYDRWFVGGREAAMNVQALEQKRAELLVQIRATGDDAAAAALEQEMSARLAMAQATLQQAMRSHSDRALGFVLALAVAMVVLMSAEAALASDSPWRSVLITARFLVIAGGAALLLAQPQLLRGVWWLGAVGALVLAVVLASLARQIGAGQVGNERR
jgi:hypothetical protein